MHFALFRWVLAKDDGTAEMRAISEPIREGSEGKLLPFHAWLLATHMLVHYAGYLQVQYKSIARLSVVVGLLIFFSYKLRPDHMGAGGGGVDSLGSNTLGMIGTLSFFLGAACSAMAGYVSMWVAVRANIRVASAARRSYTEALVLCFRGGAFSAVLVIAMCVLGVTLLHALVHLLFVPATVAGQAHPMSGSISATDVPLLIVGYGFGASFVALFMQLGGGIYTKAADVGADMVGKIEAGIPEDDPRNPAVIADLVGDNVGDCAGSSADIFESVAAEIIGAMILGGTLAKEGGIESPAAFIFFPVVVHAFDIIVSSAGILAVGDGSTPNASADPMAILQRGYRVALGLALVGFAFTTRWLLYTDAAPTAWLHYFGCGLIGMACSFVFVNSTQYYTDYKYSPVQEIARASTTGHGTNIIAGVAVGMQSTVIPVLAVSVSVIAAYWLGHSSGLGAGHSAGLFGTAVSTMGMLSSAGYVLAMNNFGPIADNAGGIVEMSQQPEAVRDATDRLDAAGNVTKAITKGYSIGSAAMACFLLFGALLDEFSAFAGRPFDKVDISTPEVLIGGLLGVMMVFAFVGLSVAAVGRSAMDVVHEVRRQLREFPGILEGKVRPKYKACVAIVTESALREMRLPGLLTVAMPVAVGLTFRWIGHLTDRPMLGAEVLCSFVMFATVAGILMALFLDTAGGAWDNAKKYVEMGNFGGKGSEAHKAAVTGDTVGDPFKDTAGPSLHVVIKLLSTTILVLGPLFVPSGQ